MRSRSQAAREAAYTEFVAARQSHLRRVAYVLCGDWRQADEMLQRALTKLYVAWPRLERAGTEEAYVRRLLVRARVRDGVPQPAGDPLLTALLSLPPKQRRVVLLRQWLDLSVEETAEELGISVGRVRAQTARARASFAADLARESR